MIKFDPTKISCMIVNLKTITTSMGGSISVVDEALSTDEDKVYKRLPIPFSIARDFIKRHKKVTRYLRPVVTGLLCYENRVISMERHPLGTLGTIQYEGAFGTTVWEPLIQQHFSKYVNPIIAKGDRDWFFDGRYVYSFEAKDVGTVIKHATNLSKAGNFRKVLASTFDMQTIHDPKKVAPLERSCLAFVTGSGSVAISPPIWKNLSDVGSTQLSKSAADTTSSDDGDDDEDEDASGSGTELAFDQIDLNLSVNLNFALKAGVEIGREFGYEAVEPLQLPRLMVELHTVNLPNISPQVKATYDIGMKFTHALSWLLGISRRANTLDSYIVMRSLMKHLTQKGIFRSNVFDASNVFKDDKTVNDVELKELSDLTTSSVVLQASLDSLMQDSPVDYIPVLV